MRRVFAVAEFRGPVLQKLFSATKNSDNSVKRLGNLVEEMLEILEDEELCELAGGAMLLLLLKHVLPVRAYTLKLRVKQGQRECFALFSLCTIR